MFQLLRQNRKLSSLGKAEQATYMPAHYYLAVHLHTFSDVCDNELRSFDTIESIA